MRRIIPGNFKGDKNARNLLYKLGVDFDKTSQQWYFAAGLPDVDERINKVPGMSKKKRRRAAVPLPKTPPKQSSGAAAIETGPPPMTAKRQRVTRSAAADDKAKEA